MTKTDKLVQCRKCKSHHWKSEKCSYCAPCKNCGHRRLEHLRVAEVRICPTLTFQA